MADLADGEVQAIGQLEQKICEGETLLRRAQMALLVNGFFIGAGLLVMVILNDAFILVGLFVITLCVWRMYRGLKFLQEIETSLSTLRVQKVERMAAMFLASRRENP
jgi:hypothetical protein